MNVRTSEPKITAVPIPSAKGAVFSVVGYVSDGDLISGNALWYKTEDGNYLWSGNVEVIKEESTKILHAPLAQLICTQSFGKRPEVYKNLGSPGGHNGLDFRTRRSDDLNNWKQGVFAVLPGVVSEAGYDAKFKGNYIRITHTNGCESVYLHLSKLEATQGDKVEAGKEIGVSGNSGGASEAPHLHFGYRPVKYNANNGYMGYIDPTPLFIDEIKYI